MNPLLVVRVGPRASMLLVAMAFAAGGCGVDRPPTIWVENRSPHAATFFVTDLGSGPAPWYIVPPHTIAHVGSDGLHTFGLSRAELSRGGG